MKVGKLIRATLTLNALAFALISAAGASAMAEAVQFHAADVNPTPLRQRLAQQRGTTALPQPGDLVGGELYRPAGTGPFPAIVALHGCGGWSRPAFERLKMERYLNLGYTVLDVDSFGPRGIRQECLPTGAQADRIGDAFGALDWLASQAFIDPGRVAVLGFSQGAEVALFSVSHDGAAQGYRHHFKAAIAYYPACSPSFAHVTVPTLVLIGDKDDWSSAADCRTMMVEHDANTVPESLVVLAGASHGFDLMALAGRPLDEFGHHLEYSQAADEAAFGAVTAFLEQYLAH